MQRKYTPPAGQAECPFCDATVAAVDAGGALRMVSLFYRCPACGRRWNELRQAGEPIARFWTPAEGAAEAAL
jgi:transposase-like protein